MTAPTIAYWPVTQRPPAARRSCDLGASAFVTKPVRLESLVEIMDGINRYRFETVELPA
jgi:hypothetical protein